MEVVKEMKHYRIVDYANEIISEFDIEDDEMLECKAIKVED